MCGEKSPPNPRAAALAKKLLATLPPEDRALLDAIFRRGMSLREYAAEGGYNRELLRERYHQVIAHLREEANTGGDE